MKTYTLWNLKCICHHYYKLIVYQCNNLGNVKKTTMLTLLEIYVTINISLCITINSMLLFIEKDKF